MRIKFSWKQLLTVGTLICWAALNGSANAQQRLVYDNGVGGAAGVNVASRSDDDGLRRHANDVTLSQTTRISNVAWVGSYSPDNTPPDSDDFTIAIYADDGGKPRAGAPLSQFSVGNDVHRADTGFSTSGNNNIYRFNALINFRMLANTTYWVSIYNNTVGENDDFFWGRTSGGNSYRTTDSSASWELNNPAREFDFRLYEFPIFNNVVSQFNQNSCFASDSQSFIGADLFQRPRPTTIHTVEWGGQYTAPAPLTDVFQIEIYEDDNGGPMGGAPLASFEVDDVDRTDLGNDLFNFSAEINFEAEANTPYWITIYHSEVGFCRNSLFPASHPFAFSGNGGASWTSIPDRKMSLVMYGFDTSPSNDDYNSGQDLIFPFSEMASNTAASTETGEQQLQNTGSTVWWYFTALGEGTVTIDTFGSNFDTQLHVYTGYVNGAGTTAADLTLVANNDDFGGPQSKVSFYVEAGELYDFRVGGFRSSGASPGAEGSIALNGTFAPLDILGDVNRDGAVDFGDIPSFISVLQSSDFQAEADCDENREVNFSDIPAFIAILSGS